VKSLPVPEKDVIAPSSEATLLDLEERFRMADVDGSGRIDRSELRLLLESVEGGRAYPVLLGQGWLPEERLDAAMAKYDVDESGDIDFEEFKQMIYDGLLLEGTLDEYEAAFNAVDNSGNGTIGATELTQLFRNLSMPTSLDKVAETFMKFDRDESGQIEFGEFLLMFRDQLLDLEKFKAFSTNQPTALSTEDRSILEPVGGLVSIIFTEAELEEVLAKNPDKLAVMFCGLTWCRPCKGVARSYEKLAELYSDAVFLKLYGNANLGCKQLFKHFKVRSTPSFLFFRNGSLVGSCTGANKERLETHLRQYLDDEELEGKGPLFLPVPSSVV